MAKNNARTAVKKKMIIFFIIIIAVICGISVVLLRKNDDNSRKYNTTAPAIIVNGKVYCYAGKEYSFIVDTKDLEQIGTVQKVYKDASKIMTENDPELSCNFWLEEGDSVFKESDTTIIISSSNGLTRYEIR